MLQIFPTTKMGQPLVLSFNGGNLTLFSSQIHPNCLPLLIILHSEELSHLFASKGVNILVGNARNRTSYESRALIQHQRQQQTGKSFYGGTP